VPETPVRSATRAAVIVNRAQDQRRGARYPRGLHTATANAWLIEKNGKPGKCLGGLACDRAAGGDMRANSPSGDSSASRGCLVPFLVCGLVHPTRSLDYVAFYSP
jgi:hypothetical protein